MTRPTRSARRSTTEAGTTPRAWALASSGHTAKTASWAGRGRYVAFALPGGLLLAALSIYPVFLLLRMAFSEVSTATLNQVWPFVGWSNFTALFESPDFPAATWHTAVFVTVVTSVGVVGGFAVALAVRSSARSSAALLAVMVFVWALPPVVNGSAWKFLLADQGLVNQGLRFLGSSNGIPFLFDQHWALLSVAAVNSWAVIPFNALVFRAGLLSVDASVLEAADLDGAGPWQQVRYVLIPSVRPTAVVLTILTIVYAFRSFDFIYVMTSGGPGDATTTLPFLSYTQAFTERDYGMGSATGVLTLAVVAVLSVLYVRSTREEVR